MSILIQYEGFVVSVNSRTYNFRVIDGPEDFRQFAVKVPFASFRPTLLRFQDGPPICFNRVTQELDKETPESRAHASLQIGEPEIQEYLERHYPRKPRRKGPAPKPSPNRSHLW